MLIVFLLTAALTPDALSNAITQMKAAETHKGACSLSTQIKAARMQLELAREAKDYVAPESLGNSIAELLAEAKTGCAGAVSSLEATITILKGGTAELPEEDKELLPEPSVDAPKKPFREKGPVFSAPLDMQGRLDALVKVLGPAWKPLGDVKDARAKRVDWLLPLEAGKCYAFIAAGAQQTKRVALYLFDGRGRERAVARAKQVSTTLYFCPFVTGDYQLQAKAVNPAKGYLVGGYVRD